MFGEILVFGSRAVAVTYGFKGRKKAWRTSTAKNCLGVTEPESSEGSKYHEAQTQELLAEAALHATRRWSYESVSKENTVIRVQTGSGPSPAMLSSVGDTHETACVYAMFPGLTETPGKQLLRE